MEDDEETEDHKDPYKVAMELGKKNLEEELNTYVDKFTEENYESVRKIPEALMNMEVNLETERTSEEVCSKFDSLLPPLEQWKKEKNERISSLERSYNEIYAKWQNAEAQRKKNQTEIEDLKSQVSMQCTYCANLGAVLGHLLWRASEMPKMIDFWLSERSKDKILGEFLGIADTTIAVFVKAYGDDLPPKSRDEYKFVMGLLGTLTNVAATAEGRQLLIENAAGKCLVTNLVTYLPRIPTASGLSIKKVILLMLWNMSVNNNCHRYLFELHIGRVIIHCLDESNPPEIRQLGLKILQSITHDLEPQLFDELIDGVPIEKIRQIAHGGQDEIADHALEILDHFESHQNQILRSRNQYFNK